MKCASVYYSMVLHHHELNGVSALKTASHAHHDASCDQHANVQQTFADSAQHAQALDF